MWWSFGLPEIIKVTCVRLPADFRDDRSSVGPDIFPIHTRKEGMWFDFCEGHAFAWGTDEFGDTVFRVGRQNLQGY